MPNHLEAVEHSLRSIPGGQVTIRDAGVTQKLSPRSPLQPFFSREAVQPRRAPRVVDVAPFRLAAVPVTRALWHQVRGDAAPPPLAEHPVTEVSWFEALEFCNALSRQAGLAPAYAIEGELVRRDMSAGGYRLPSEAEWQHACGARPTALDEHAWHAGNAGDVVHAVGRLRPNALGLFDMLGNVWEWCEDLFDPAVYGSYRVFRGGGFADPAASVRPEVRRKSHPTHRIDDLGFRLARPAQTETIP